MTAEHFVRRPRLVDLLADDVRAPLTLVVAPAGAGKTSLVAGWITDAAPVSAWLSLDETDRDLVTFWTGMIAALEALVPGCGQRALTMFRRARTRDAAVEQLLADLEGGALPSAVLVVDDVHHVDGNQAIVASVARFVRQLPQWLHVVLISRREPDMAIDRMRSQGRLGEVRFAELRFSPDEAVEFLRRLAPTLPGPAVDATVQRADGWVTSLQLAALAARSARARSAEPVPGPADDGLIRDYVLHEVLASERSDVIEILTAAAAVPRINGALAHAMTGRDDAGDLLVEAERRGLFVTRRGRGWFDLHALVRGVLASELAAGDPGRLAALHTSAAQWFEGADEPLLALEQWASADRPRELLRLLAAKHSDLYDRGHEATVARMVAAIPERIGTADLAAMIEYAWCHLLVDRRRFLELVDQLDWLTSRAAPSPTLAARVNVLRSSSCTIRGHWSESAAGAREALADLGDEWATDSLGRFAWNAIAREVALTERWDETDADVRRAALALSHDPERRLALEGTRALGEALAGRPLDALRLTAGARHAAAVSQMTILTAELGLAEALAHRELGDRGALAELAAIADTPTETMLYCRILAMAALTQAHLDRGDVSAARQALEQAQTLADSECFEGDGRDWLTRAGVLLALAEGGLEPARRWADGVTDPFWSGISRARVHLAAGERFDALDALEALVPRCVRHEVVLALLRARLVTDGDEAMKCAGAAVELAAAHGLLQTVASEGALELVERAAWRAPAPWLDRLRRAAAEGRSAPFDEPPLTEPLTDRERDVLRFLPSRLTVQEIADELYVSVNTVKFHLRVIYRKLGVNSRAQAAQAARRMMHVRR